jgi:3-oxoacid CoA-transferase subunit B
VIDVTAAGLVLKEMGPGTTLEAVQQVTEPKLQVDSQVRTYRV